MEELLEIPSMEVVKLNVTDSEITRMEEEYMGLTVEGIEDKAGLKRVYESRQTVKKTRTGLIKFANELKEKALAWQRKVNAEKDRVVSRLEAIEAHLQGEEDRIEAEKERIRKEAEAKEAARIQARIDTLAAYGFQIEYATITMIDDATFQKVLENARVEHEKELARKAEEARLQAEEAARLKAEREELERLRAEQAEAARIIRENNERIAREQAEREAAIRREEERLARQKREQEEKVLAEARRIEEEKRIEQARIEAAEAARLQAIEDARRQQEEKEEAERQAKIDEERQMALRPDKEKLQGLSDLLGSIEMPSVKDEAAQVIVNEVQVMLNKIQGHIIKKIKVL